jgi:hypothetical protein
MGWSPIGGLSLWNTPLIIRNPGDGARGRIIPEKVTHTTEWYGMWKGEFFFIDTYCNLIVSVYN